MSYPEWRKRTKLFDRLIPARFYPEVTTVAMAAYLAGERAGLKRGEEMCKNKIELDAIMRGKND